MIKIRLVSSRWETFRSASGMADDHASYAAAVSTRLTSDDSRESNY